MPDTTSHSSAPETGTVPDPARMLAGDEWIEKLRDGSHVLIRPIQHRDTDLERRFIERLSPEAKRMRFLGGIGRPSDAMLRKLVDIDVQHELALVALVHRENEKREVGVARFSQSGDAQTCECAVTVADDWQGKGLGSLLMRHLIELARQRGYRHMFSVDERDNEAMKDLAHFLGFSRELDPDDPSQVIHRLEL